jgi:hypothetical protein
VKKIVVEKEEVKLYYNLPVPPDSRKKKVVEVLPIATFNRIKSVSMIYSLARWSQSLW